MRAAEVYYARDRPFPVNPKAAPAAGERDPEGLDLTEVVGDRVLETVYLPRISLREEKGGTRPSTL